MSVLWASRASHITTENVQMLSWCEAHEEILIRTDPANINRPRVLFKITLI